MRAENQIAGPRALRRRGPGKNQEQSGGKFKFFLVDYKNNLKIILQRYNKIRSRL
jgi:hypothetical protein